MKADQIEREWQRYRAAAVAEGASELQLRDLRYAFFAGFCSLFIAIEDVPEDEPESRTAARIEAWRDELNAHTKEVREDGEDAGVLESVHYLHSQGEAATLQAIVQHANMPVETVKAGLRRLARRKLVVEDELRFRGGGHPTYWRPGRRPVVN